MELSSMIKTILKQLKYAFIIFVSFFVTLAIISLFLKDPSYGYYKTYETACCILSCMIFAFMVGKTIYGNYGKTFMYIQNNRIFFTLCSIIIGLLCTVILTIIETFTRFASVQQYQFYNVYIPGFIITNVSFNTIAIAFSIFLTCYALGAIYGLFVKHNNILRKIIIPLFVLIIVCSSFILNPFDIESLDKILIFYQNKELMYLIIFNVFNILSLTLCSFYYCKLEVIKVYSAE